MDEPCTRQEADEPNIFVGGGDGIPTPGFCNTLLFGGILILFVAGAQGAGWRPADTGPFAQGLVFFGLTLAGIGGWLWQTRERILALSTSAQISARLGVDESDLPTFAAQKGVKPRYLVNGQPFYDLSDFAATPALNAQTLLRAASHDTRLLLVPAQPTSSHHTPHLLRPASTLANEQTAFAPTLPLTAAPEETLPLLSGHETR